MKLSRACTSAFIACVAFFSYSLSVTAQGPLTITGIIDGPRTGGTPKAIEFYVNQDISDASIFSIQNFNNGGTTAGTTFTLPSGPLTAGTFLYVASESPGFTAYFGFAPTFTTNALNVNGNDVVQIRQENTLVVDTFGVIGVDPALDTAWNYQDTFAYRLSGTINTGSFNLSDYTFPTGQSDALDILGTNGVNPGIGDPLRFPVGTYSPTPVPEPTTMLAFGAGVLAVGGAIRRRVRA